MANWRSFVLFENEDVCSLSCGTFLAELLNNFGINNGNHTPLSAPDPKDYKFFLYSTHDTSLISILSALKVFDQKWPQFSSYIIFELYENVKTKQDFVQIIYNGKELSLPESFQNEYQQQHKGDIPKHFYLLESFSKFVSPIIEKADKTYLLEN